MFWTRISHQIHQNLFFFQLESGGQRHALAGAAGINRARIHTEREATFLREAGQKEIAALQRLNRLLDRFLRVSTHDVTFDVELQHELIVNLKINVWNNFRKKKIQRSDKKHDFVVYGVICRKMMKNCCWKSVNRKQTL